MTNCMKFYQYDNITQNYFSSFGLIIIVGFNVFEGLGTILPAVILSPIFDFSLEFNLSKIFFSSLLFIFYFFCGGFDGLEEGGVIVLPFSSVAGFGGGVVF